MFYPHKRYFDHDMRKAAILGIFLLSLPGCHRVIDGRDIDVPPQRPGRFVPEAAPAEQKAAQQELRREEQLSKQKSHMPHDKSQKEEDAREEEHYEPLPPEYSGGGTPGSIKTQNGHTVTPQTNVIYGAPQPPITESSTPPSSP